MATEHNGDVMVSITYPLSTQKHYGPDLVTVCSMAFIKKKKKLLLGFAKDVQRRVSDGKAWTQLF